MRAFVTVFVATAALAILPACQQSPESPSSPAAAKGLPSERSARFLGCCDPNQPFTLDSTNPYYPLTAGSTWLLEGEEDGVPVKVEVEVLAETEVVGEVETRVVLETEWEYDEEAEAWALLEVSRNYFAETLQGDVCYFGEAVDIYEDGQIVSHAGAWRADEPGNLPGLFMPADPGPGERFPQECAPGIAEDQALVLGAGRIEVPAGTFTETIRVREHNPLDGDLGFKAFAAGVGMVVDGPLELVDYEIAP